MTHWIEKQETLFSFLLSWQPNRANRYSSLTLTKECETEKNGQGHGEAGWWKEQLENADADQNGSLCFDEFKE
jgi:hypothetical protein